jgi:hypothetical protein
MGWILAGAVLRAVFARGAFRADVLAAAFTLAFGFCAACFVFGIVDPRAGTGPRGVAQADAPGKPEPNV